MCNDTGYQYTFVLRLLPSDQIAVLQSNWDCCLLYVNNKEAYQEQ